MACLLSRQSSVQIPVSFRRGGALFLCSLLSVETRKFLYTEVHPLVTLQDGIILLPAWGGCKVGVPTFSFLFFPPGAVCSCTSL